MIGLCRLWLKLVVAIVLVVGCNVAAPAMSVAADAAVLTSDMPCHDQQGSGDAVPTLCGKACLAIAATAPAVVPSLLAPIARFAVPLPVFTGQTASPDTPPPRPALDA